MADEKNDAAVAPADDGDFDDSKPIETLEEVPAVFRSDDPARPLEYVDVKGNRYTYFWKPMWTAAVFILMLEFAERFAYYGLSPEYQAYLQLPQFANMAASESVSTAQLMRALGYCWPLISALFADAYFGVFKTLLATAVVYQIALVLITLAGSAELFQDWMVPVYFYVLFPMGFGGIKSLVNVMGANQFHPVVHKETIGGFYLQFYMFINLGAITSTLVQVYANNVKDDFKVQSQQNNTGSTEFMSAGAELWKPFSIPAAAFAAGMIIFLVGLPRYVYRKPIGSAIMEILRVLRESGSTCPPSLDKQKEENGGKYQSTFVEDTRQLLMLVPLLFVANFFFAMAYWQQDTLVIQQGFEMSSTWGVQSNELNSLINPVCVVLFAFVLERFLLPWLRHRNMEPGHMNKFILGCLCGILAMVWGFITDLMLRGDWKEDNEKNISVFWSIPVYALVALGEVWANPAALDMAYQIAPDSLKAVASGVHGVMSGAVPNFVSAAIAAGLSSYLKDGNGCPTRNPNFKYLSLQLSNNDVGDLTLDCNSTLLDPNSNITDPNGVSLNVPAPIWDYRTVSIAELYLILAIFPAVGIVVIHFTKPYYNHLIKTKRQQMLDNTRLRKEEMDRMETDLKSLAI